MTDHTQERQTAGAIPRKDAQSEPTRDPLAEARQRIIRLQVADQEHESTERALRERTLELVERVKELNCLYSISNLVESPNISLQEILQGTADLIPPAWQHPEIAAARIVLEGQEFRTENWAEDVHCRQSADILVHGQPGGSVEVCYLQEPPESDKGPFLQEERSLLQAIAEHLGRFIERIRAEQALEQERDRAQKYLDVAGVILVVIAPDRTVTLINRQGCEILGYGQDEILGQDWFERFVPRQNRQAVVAVFEQLMADEIEPIEYFENPIVTRGGEERVIAWHNTVLRDLAGHITGALSSGEDITERVSAEQALRRAHDELEQRVQERTAEIEQGRQRESVLNALLRLSMEETSLDEQLERALDQILSIPWLPVLRQGAIFIAETGGGTGGPLKDRVLRLRVQRGLPPALQASCALIRFGQCLCGRAAAESKIEFADRVDERHEIVYEGMSPHGHYCVPILSIRAANLDQGEVIGTIVLYLEEGHRRTDQEEEFLRAIANTLASMIERGRAADALRQSEQRLRELNARLEAYSRTLEQRVRERTHEIERRSQVAESLRGILAMLNSDRPLTDILEHIVAEASRLLQSEASAIYRLQQDEAQFEVQAAAGRSAQWTDTGRLAPQLAQALRGGQPVAFSDLLAGEAGDRHSGFLLPFPPDCLVQGCRALLAVPLVIAEDVYGALALYYAQPRAFAEDEVQLTVVFADQAALAIENARLHQHAREAAIVQERARLARELHDSVTQSLYSLTLLAEGWRRLGSTGRLVDTDDPLKELGELAQQALKEMRLMVYELRPPALEQEGLLGALHQRLGTVEQRAGVEARLLAQAIVDLPAPVEEGLYRIAIEALNNALKHASATVVTVLLDVDGDWVTVEVRDDGQGFDPEAARDSLGMGLHTMRERAQELGGTLTIRSAVGVGTSIVASVPFEMENHGDRDHREEKKEIEQNQEIGRRNEF